MGLESRVQWITMEIEGEGVAKIALSNGHKTVFGRGLGFNTSDRTVSRRHVELEVQTNAVSFVVLGKNPIWVSSRTDGEVRVYRRLEKGKLGAGDSFCVSGKRPTWFTLRNIGADKAGKKVLEEDVGELAENSQSGSEIEDVDVSGIDPVKEFGFVVMGHEFDHYPKRMISDLKHWDWFLDEPSKESDDDEEFGKRKTRGGRGKRKKSEENGDDEWTGESEDDKKLVGNLRKVQTSKYSTRLKDRDRVCKDGKGNDKSMCKKTNDAGEDLENEDEDEEDETLDGFIVGDDDMEREEETADDDVEDEEEEFVEGDDDDDVEGG